MRKMKPTRMPGYAQCEFANRLTHRIEQALSFSCKAESLE